MLWPDTFNNYFDTQVGTACVEALEAAGFHVIMPQQHVCCGRPLYDYGFLDVAETYLRRTLRQLRNEIRKGTPLVGMEPSCLAVFRHELPRMLPNNQDAQRLHQNCYHLAEFFEKHNIQLPQLSAKAIVWGHCHHKATGGMDPEMNLLKERMGIDATEAKGGCCGLAGSWGFEEGKYDISMQCGEIGLLPAVRDADPSTAIIANGFSCKTQLRESSLGREAMHVAELIRIAQKLSVPQMHDARPEQLREPRPEPPQAIKLVRNAATIGIGVLGIVAGMKALATLKAGKKKHATTSFPAQMDSRSVEDFSESAPR